MITYFGHIGALAPPNRRSVLPALHLAVALACLSGCGAPPRAAVRPLPFHAALIPVRVEEEATPLEGAKEETGEETDEDLVRIGLESGRTSERLRAVLDGRGFARATLLAYPADAEAYDAWTDAEKEAYWLEQAKEKGADLLVTSVLTYQNAVESRRNEKFWLNFPLFLLGGPFCYFVDDRTYSMGVRLEAMLYDLSFDLEKLEDSNAEVLDQFVRTEFTETTLAFVERAGADAGAYALSLLVPAGFLASEGEKVRAEVERAAIDGIAENLLARFIDETSRINANRNLTSFSLDLEAIEIAREGVGTVSLNVPVRLLVGGRGLSRYTVSVENRQVASGAFDEEADAQGRFWLRANASVPVGSRYIQVMIWDVQANARRYTFRIPSVDAV